MKPIRRWSDVPKRQRLKLEATDGSKWRRILEQRKGRCAAAIAHYTSGLWRPCQFTASPGEEFCAAHGGRPRQPSLHPPNNTHQIEQLERRLARYRQMRDELPGQIAALETALAQLRESKP